jgi:amino acid transporter
MSDVPGKAAGDGFGHASVGARLVSHRRARGSRSSFPGDDHDRLAPATIHHARAPGRRRLLTWPDAVVLSLGSALLVTVSLGPMAGEIGAASAIVWISTASVGLVQCLLIARLACRYPDKMGGVPGYIHEGLKRYSPLFGLVAAWGYWVGWVPGVAVNLTLAATYFEAAFWPGANVLGLTLALVAILYALNCLGLTVSIWIAGVFGTCALLPLLAILAAPLVEPSVWHGGNLWPILPSGETWHSPPALLLLAKWMFVAVWSSYGAEMVATVAGELREPARDIPRAMVTAAAVTLLAFAIVPTALVAMVGAHGLAEDPYTVFLTAARGIFGGLGSTIVGFMLIVALVLGAQLFIISSSRALYQMSQDGLTLRSLGRLNRYGVPIGFVGLDAAVALLLLAIFQSNVVDVVAAANVGYVLVFVLLPLAYLQVQTRERRSGAEPAPLDLTIPVAVMLLLLNATLFLVGGFQWGLKTVGVGLLLVMTCLPLYAFRQRR